MALEQHPRNVLVAQRDMNLVAATLPRGNGVPEEVHVCGVKDINENCHWMERGAARPRDRGGASGGMRSVATRLHVEEHGEEQKLQTGDDQQGREDRLRTADALAGPLLPNQEEAEEQTRREQ